MAYHLFDSYRFGLIIALLLEIVLLLAWTFTNGRFKKRYLLAGPLLAALFITLDLLIQTNREQLEHTTRQIVTAAEDENAAGIIEHLSDNFLLANGFGKQRAAAVIESKLSQSLIDENNITSLMVNNHDETKGQVEFTVVTRMDTKSPYAAIPVVTTHWKFDYVREGAVPYKLLTITMIWLKPGMLGAKQKPIDVFTYTPRGR